MTHFKICCIITYSRFRPLNKSANYRVWDLSYKPFTAKRLKCWSLSLLKCTNVSLFNNKRCLTYFDKKVGNPEDFETEDFEPIASAELLRSRRPILSPFFRFCQTIFFLSTEKNLLNEFGIFGRSYFGDSRADADADADAAATAFVSVVTGFDGGSMTSRYGRPTTSTSWHRPRNPVCDVAKRIG